jgi:hypothetical protein
MRSDRDDVAPPRGAARAAIPVAKAVVTFISIALSLSASYGA